jgi:hypothetical protein
MEPKIFVETVIKYFEFLEKEFKYEIISKNENGVTPFLLYGNSTINRAIYFEYNAYDDFIDIVFLKYSTPEISLDNFEMQLKFNAVLKALGEKTTSVYSQNFNFDKALINSAYYMKKVCSLIINGTQWPNVEDNSNEGNSGYTLLNPKTGLWEKFDSLDEFNKRLNDLH